MKYYDNTRISDYKTCPRKYQLRHLYDLVGDGLPLALAFGLCWHDAMDIVWAMINDGEDNEEKVLEAAMARWKEPWTGRYLPFSLTLEKQERFAPRSPITNSINEIPWILCELSTI